MKVRTHVPPEQLNLVEKAALGDAVHLGEELVHLIADGGQLLLGVGAVFRLNTQLPGPAEHIVDLGQGAVGGFSKGHALLGVAVAAVQLSDIGPHPLRYGEAGGVVRRAVNPVAGGELFQILFHGAGSF